MPIPIMTPRDALDGKPGTVRPGYTPPLSGRPERARSYEMGDLTAALMS